MSLEQPDGAIGPGASRRSRRWTPAALGERLGRRGRHYWAEAGAPSAIADPKFIAQGIAVTYVAGAVLTALAVLLGEAPPVGAASPLLLWGLAAGATGLGVGVWRIGARLPAWASYALPVCSLAMITLGLLAPTPEQVVIVDGIFYALVVVHAFTVMSWRQGSVYLAAAVLLWWFAASTQGVTPVVLAIWAVSMLVLAVVVGRLARAGAAMEVDALTGAANRRGLSRALPALLTRARRVGGDVVVAVVDVDHFKMYNDRYGHGAGDELLVRLARQWALHARAAGLRPGQAVLARQGGDEFTALVSGPGASAELVVTVLEQVRRDLPAEHGCTAGVATWRAESTGSPSRPSPGPGWDPGPEVERLLERADAALYRAKRHRRGSTSVAGAPTPAAHADRGGDDPAAAVPPGAADGPCGSGTSGRGEITRADIARALDAGDLLVHFQPVVDPMSVPATHRVGGDQSSRPQVVGVEALVRWAHPERGLLPPAAFLPEMRHCGLMPRLGRAVMDQALAAVADLRDSHGRPLHLSVNASAEELADPGYADQTTALLRTHAVDPHRLCVEVLEDDLHESFSRALGHLQRLRALGVRVAVDDFGAGYSNLARLGSLPVDVVKLDRSLIGSLGTPVGSTPGALDTAPVVEAVMHMATSAGMDVVVEGVETPGHARWLRAHLATRGQIATGTGATSTAGTAAATYGQGWHWGRALPAKDVVELLRTPQDGPSPQAPAVGSSGPVPVTAIPAQVSPRAAAAATTHDDAARRAAVSSG